ncbi:MAG: hypothetical protein K1000chlam4_00226 [Chlamydiae bacterium]|nr:hypothetical protein [Chlamydiota bacterium]
MQITHILEELAFDMGELPREAIEAAITKRKAMTPHLLQILNDAVERIDEIIENDNYQGHLYAMYLLAQYREPAAYPLILKLISFPGEIPHVILGDVLTEDLSRILASVCDGDILPIQHLIENPLINEYVRAAGQSSLITLVGCGLLPRKSILSYFRSLMTELLERRRSHVWDNLISCCCDLYPNEILDTIISVFDEGLVDSEFITNEDVRNILKKNQEDHLFKLFQDAELIEDTVTEMEKWLSSSAF